MTIPTTTTDRNVPRVLSVLLGTDGVPSKTREIATTLGIPEEHARVAVKSCLEAGWARREGQASVLTARGRTYARARGVKPQPLAVPVAPVELEPNESYAERRAAELLGGGFSVEEVAGILKLLPEQVRKIRPMKAPQRTGEIATDSRPIRGAVRIGPARVEDFMRSPGSHSLVVGW